jgi:hypothetical protein
MSPWDEMEHFDIPFVTIVTCVPGAITVLVQKDPRRVALYINNPTSLAVVLAPNDVPVGLVAGTGYCLSNTSYPFSVKQKDDGALAQVAWCAANGNASSVDIQVIQLLLKDWPNE